MRRPHWLSHNLAVLSGVSLAQDAASELLYPVMPILLTSVLGAPDAVVGIVEGVAEGASAITKYIAGRVSDVLSRRAMIGTGYSAAALGKAIVAFSVGWPMVLAGRVVDRLGKGVRGAPRDSLLAEEVDAPELGRVFGFHRLADTLGAVIGPLLGLAVLALTGGNVRVALAVALVPAAVSVALVPLARDPRRSRRERGGESQGPVSPLRLPARLRAVVAVLGVVSLVNFPDALILLRVHQIGFSAAAVTAAYALYNLSYALISYPAGALSDRVPRARVYALGLVCFVVGYAGLGATQTWWLVLVILVIYGGFNGFTDSVGKAWISHLAPAGMRGRAQGLFQGITSGAVLVAGVWAGLAWDSGPGRGTVPLFISGAVAAVAAVALWMLAPRLQATG